MRKRGPKPVDVSQLRFEASSLATALFELRDGRPELLVHLKGGVWQTTLQPELRRDEIGHPERVRQHMLTGRMRYRPVRSKVGILVVPRRREARKDALGVVRGSKHWTLVSGVPAKPEVWKRLEIAHSVADVREISRRLTHPLLRSTLYSHAEAFLRAKRLPHCPKSNRPRSDTKRIEFFGKVLAGLSLGIAPATATKRLANFVPSTGDITKHLKLSDYTDVLKRTRKGGETK